MKVVVDSTSLIGLSQIGRFEILKELFGKIYISSAIYDEVVEKGQGRAGAYEVEKADWVIKRKIRDRLAVHLLEKDLDTGEAEAIILAQELKAEYVVLDDKVGRKIAKFIGLSVIGTLGLLLLAMEKGIITDLRGIVDELRVIGFRISDELYQKILGDRNE